MSRNVIMLSREKEIYFFIFHIISALFIVKAEFEL